MGRALWAFSFVDKHGSVYRPGADESNCDCGSLISNLWTGIIMNLTWTNQIEW